MFFGAFSYTHLGVTRKKNLSTHLLKAIRCAHVLPWPGAPEPGAPPLDLDSFAGESMRGVWSVDTTTTKTPGFNLKNTACFRWEL